MRPLIRAVGQLGLIARSDLDCPEREAARRAIGAYDAGAIRAYLPSAAPQSKLAEALEVAGQHLAERQAERDAAEAVKKLSDDITRDREKRKIANRKFERSLASLKAQFSHLSH